MTKIKSCIHGIYPRSKSLVQASRDFERKRITAKELRLVQADDAEKLLSAQKSAHFDYYEDGKLTWHDIFRPVVEACEGMDTGPLTRWFDNNCFYRQPIITGPIKLDLKKIDAYFPRLAPEQKWKVTLPSPFLFAKLSQDTTTMHFEESLERITELTAEIIRFVSNKGAQIIQLNEPYIPYYQSGQKELKLFEKTLAELGKSKNDSQLGVHFYFGDAASAVKALIRSGSIDIVGIDFYKTSLSGLPTGVPFDIIAGVIDGRNSLLEKEAIAAKFLKKAVKQLGPKQLYIANNSDLELLPEPVAKAKLELLHSLQELLNKTV